MKGSVLLETDVVCLKGRIVEAWASDIGWRGRGPSARRVEGEGLGRLSGAGRLELARVRWMGGYDHLARWGRGGKRDSGQLVG